MQLIETPIEGTYILRPDKKGDERGYFARLFCRKLFSQLGLEPECVQINTSKSAQKGTLRGMHYQLPPFAESKLLTCTQGALFDMILDLRPDSPTYMRSFGAELSAENGLMMYLPKGCAHGFLTLKDETQAIYFVSEYYNPEAERGVRWNDPAFNLQWPEKPVVISEKDQNHPDFHADTLQRR